MNDVKETSAIMSIGRVETAVCIHVFYPDVFEVIALALCRLSLRFDLYITCPKHLLGRVNEILAQNRVDLRFISENGEVCRVFEVDNIGMDVLPFIYLIDQADLPSYRFVLKLHTKNSLNELGKTLGALSLRALFSSDKIVQEIANAFKSDTKLFIVGCHDLYRSSNHMMYGNRSLVQDILTLLGLRPSEIDWGFFAGTMFWIRGEVLDAFREKYSHLVRIALLQNSQNEKTGRDGSIAHALERIWGALELSSGRKVGLVIHKSLEPLELVLTVLDDVDALKHPIRRVGVSESLIRWSRFERDLSIMKSSAADFEPNRYQLSTSECHVYGIDPYLHFIIYGDILGIDPGDGFSICFYKLRRPDVVRDGEHVFVHWLRDGKREGMTASPTWEDWIHLAQRISYFDRSWYMLHAPHFNDEVMSVVDHYRIIGRHLGLSTSPNFDPDTIPLARDGVSKILDVVEFMRISQIEEKALNDELARVVENKDYYIIPRLVDQYHHKFGVSAATLGALGLAYLKLQRWNSASQVLQAYWNASEAGTLPVRHRRSVNIDKRHGNESILDVVRWPEYEEQASVCVYTTLYGDIDDLPSVFSQSKYCDFICFTDRRRAALGWKYVVVDPGFDDGNINAKFFKVNSHLILQDYNYTMFMDANTLICGRIDEFIEHYLIGNRFVMFRHPERSDVCSEGVGIVESKRHSPARILEQLHAYTQAGLPENTGLVEASFIWRIVGDESINQLMANWWKHIVSFTRRDQLSLGFLMWSENLQPRAIPSHVGNSRRNVYFVKLAHNDIEKSQFKAGRTNNCWGQSARSADVWVLYDPKNMETGSTVLRGYQLHSIMRECFNDNRSVFYSSFDEVSNKIVYLTKGFLLQKGVPALERLKARGNILIGDFVDAKPAKEAVDLLDVVIASSISAYIDYKGRFPKSNVHMITHHVDYRIPESNTATEFMAGYFGELVNTTYIDRVGSVVHAVSVDTSKSKDDWLNEIGKYNFHYAFRKRRTIDNHKPFLKGFVAAHCNANMLIQKGSGDAPFYLGDAYPYLVSDSATADEVLTVLQRAKEGFRSSEWYTGLEIMAEVRARSSRQYVIGEIKALMDSIL